VDDVTLAGNASAAPAAPAAVERALETTRAEKEQPLERCAKTAALEERREENSWRTVEFGM